MNIGKISAENFAIRQNSAKTTNNHLSKHNASSPYSELSKASSLDILANQKRAFVEKSPNVQKISFGANLSKIPEFLYHVTSKASANSILTSGKILPNVESATGLKGVFAFDMDNFLKFWNLEDANGHEIGRKLFNRLSFSEDIALLRIPTSKLNTDNLKIRSQNVVFDNISTQRRLFEDLSDEERQLQIAHLKATNGHFRKGASASELDKYANDAIEYIYPEEIKVTPDMLVGTAKYSNFSYSPDMVKEALRQLTIGQPEAKYFK